MKAPVLAVTLFCVWLLWSGHFTPVLIPGFGVVSCLFVVFLLRRMNIVDEEAVPAQLGVRPFIFYAPWLVKEIVLANFDVAGRILHPSLPIRPAIVRVTAGQKGDLARVIYANSITLTPGTVSIDMEGDQITVHALSLDAAADIGGEMNRRVSDLEGST